MLWIYVSGYLEVQPASVNTSAGFQTVDGIQQIVFQAHSQKLLKVTFSFVTNVCPSAWNISAPQWTDFSYHFVFEDFSEICGQNKISTSGRLMTHIYVVPHR